jgi:hypothetical protein
MSRVKPHLLRSVQKKDVHGRFVDDGPWHARPTASDASLVDAARCRRPPPSHSDVATPHLPCGPFGLNMTLFPGEWPRSSVVDDRRRVRRPRVEHARHAKPILSRFGAGNTPGTREATTTRRHLRSRPFPFGRTHENSPPPLVESWHDGPPMFPSLFSRRGTPHPTFPPSSLTPSSHGVFFVFLTRHMAANSPKR